LEEFQLKVPGKKMFEERRKEIVECVTMKKAINIRGRENFRG